MRCAAGVALVLAAGGAVQAAEPQWGLKAGALAGAPVAEGEQRSSRVTVQPSLKLEDGAWTLRADARLRRLELTGERSTRTDLRDLTLGWRGTSAALTLGAQQVNWGRMDLLRVTDAINPVDQGDLFLEELPESKLALWMANAEWQHGSHALQAIVAPQPALDRLPEAVGGLPVQDVRPAASLHNATVALRYGFETAGWNADAVAIRGWQTTPALVPGPDGTGGLRLRAQPARQDSLGLSADRPIGGIVLRLEGQLARTRPYEPPPGNPAERRRSATLGLGADLTEGDWFLAAQLIAREESNATPRRIAYVSAIVQRKWLHDRLTVRAVHLRETDTGSSWTSLQSRYELSPHHELRLQADRFAGAATQPFGVYAPRSRVALGLEARF